jgi:AsmA family protein
MEEDMASRRVVVWSLVFGTPVLLVVAVAMFWGWDLLIPLLQSRASAALGRPVAIAHLHVSPGRILRITADDVVVGNPPKWEGEPLATIPRLTVEADAWTYIRHGQLVVPLVEIQRPLVVATQSSTGDANYRLNIASGNSNTKIGDVRIDDGRARVGLAKLQADFELSIATREADGQSQIVVTAQGTYAAQPINGQLIGGALLSLRDPSHPWPIDLRLSNGPTKVVLVGTLLDPLALHGASLNLQFAGPDMSLLDKLTGLPLPKTPIYQITGKLDFADGRVQFRDFKGRVGNSDLEGTIDVDPGKDRPEMVADLASRRVDLVDLGGFIGAEPGRTSTTSQANDRVLPGTPISVPKLQGADIHLKYRGQRIQGQSLPLDNLDVALDIVNGQVKLHPVTFGVGSGRIKGNIALGTQDPLPHAKADIEFQSVDVSRLMAATHLFEGAGTISGTGQIDATGNSLAQMLGNGNGAVRLGMVGGDLSALLVDLSGLQFGNALLSALGLPNKRTSVECFIGDFALQRGVMAIQALVLDTGEGIINGSGTANLKDEALDLQLRTESKHFTIGSLPAPIKITGTLKHPNISPGKELLARGGLAAGLAAAFPPLALLPTIQFGTGEDHRCNALLARAKQQPGGRRLPPPNEQTRR